jgi:hypothetical protein
MALLPGGEFRAGSERGLYSPEESPRFVTRLAPFCMDLTEVTVAAYQACVGASGCTPAGTRSALCNSRREDRSDHPINCVDWQQADSYCRKRGARLPTEIEWEYAARGGAEYRKFPWGDEPPDGRTCWKHHGTCPAKSFAAGAYGLFDISGNVWEWTSSDFGPYPWPPLASPTKVYRGGSFSRRFAKWMHTRLRNRAAPKDSGSHLGFRCAVTAPGATCPFGKNQAGLCLHGVTDADCAPPQSWNGLRCAAAGAPDCPRGGKPEPGHGCIIPGQKAPVWVAEKGSATPVERRRTPEFDEDCGKYYPGRPRAYRYERGTHSARTRISAQAGCKNRDVGVGWNSTCCP